MKLRYGTRIHDVTRVSTSVFRVDAAVVGFEDSDGRKDRVRVARSGDRVYAQVGGRSYALSVVSRAVAAASDATAHGGLEAPMPGRVTRIAVAVGDAVKRGQELIVVEAMKMENAITAPVDGVVKSLLARVGDMVSPGPALIELA